jgi:anti-anti-sigma regulatory factor
MFWDVSPPPAPQPEFSAESARLRPGVPVVRARGRLDRATVGELRRAVDRCLRSTPWAVVVDLTGVTELRAGAVPKLGDLAGQTRAECVGLHLVTNGGAVDGLLEAAAASGLLVIHHSMAAAQRALGR